MTGSRSVRVSTNSNDRLAAPITAEARNSMVSTPDSRRICPTSWRLRKCGGKLRVVVVAQAAKVDDPPHTGSGCRHGNVHRRPAILLFEIPLGGHQVNKVERRVNALEEPVKGRNIQQIPLDDLRSFLHMATQLLGVYVPDTE